MIFYCIDILYISVNNVWKKFKMQFIQNLKFQNCIAGRIILLERIMHSKAKLCCLLINNRTRKNLISAIYILFVIYICILYYILSAIYILFIYVYYIIY